MNTHTTKTRLIAATTLAMLAANAHAQTQNNTSATTSIPKIIRTIESKNAHATFLGTIDGMRGYLITKTRKSGQILAIPVYITPDGKTAILGHAHAINGTDETKAQETRLGLRLNEAEQNTTLSPPLNIDNETQKQTGNPNPNTNATILAKHFAQEISEHTVNFEIGSPSARHVYLIGNQYCQNCTDPMEKLKRLILDGSIKVTIVMAANNRPDQNKIIALLANKKIGENWLHDTTPTGPVKHPHRIETWLNSNNTFALRVGVSQMPVIFYIDKNQKWTHHKITSASIESLATSSETP